MSDRLIRLDTGPPSDSNTRATPVDESRVAQGGTTTADPLLLALARYVQAVDQRYPGGLEQMRNEGPASRANMRSVMLRKGPAR
jgi:hypothetical protein